MHRTNIYLTAEQERALAARARMSGRTRSAVLREILDEALATGTGADQDVDAALAELAGIYPDVTAGLFDADDDVRIDR